MVEEDGCDALYLAVVLAIEDVVYHMDALRVREELDSGCYS